jgi:SAM-dependent methyltransferase
LLPDGPFDLVFSTLAIHHLDTKADLFRRVASVLAAGRRFVFGDVVVPRDPADAVTPLSPDYDLPSRVDEQLGWLQDAGFEASVVWAARDLAVIAGALGGASPTRGRGGSADRVRQRRSLVDVDRRRGDADRRAS